MTLPIDWTESKLVHEVIEPLFEQGAYDKDGTCHIECPFSMAQQIDWFANTDSVGCCYIKAGLYTYYRAVRGLKDWRLAR